MIIYRIIDNDNNIKCELTCCENILQVKRICKCELQNIIDSIHNNLELKSGPFEGCTITKILV